MEWTGKKGYWLEEGEEDADGTHVCIFESSQLEGSYVGDLPYGFKASVISIPSPIAFLELYMVLQSHSIPLRMIMGSI